MARKKSSTIDKARQVIGRAITGTAKAGKKSIKKAAKQISRSVKNAQKARDAEAVARWRALKKLGIISTKNNPSAKNLTRSLRTKINKQFYDLQGAGSYAKGKVSRPLKKVTKTSSKGKTREVYELDDSFKFLRSKKAKASGLSGVIKTKNGYILAKQTKDSTFRVDKHGNVIENTGTYRIKKKGYRGQDIIQLVSDIENGKVKIRSNQALAYRPWGSARVEQLFDYDSLEDFAKMVNAYSQQMPPRIYKHWLDQTEVVFLSV